MSIYSGFATRAQQQFYDKILYNLISTLLLRLSKYYNNEPVQESVFLKIIFDHESTLKKLQKRKYLDPKYSKLLTIFKKQINGEEPEQDMPEQKQHKHHKQHKEHKTKPKQNHQFNRTLSLLGKQFGELKVHAQRENANLTELQEVKSKGSNYDLSKIQQIKKNTSKKKKKEKKTSIKSNLDIWDARQTKPPELPSLHPMDRTIMSKTKFNNFSERMKSKELQDPPIDFEQQPQSLRNVLAKPPKFRAKLYFK